jgi:hypothetical protein
MKNLINTISVLFFLLSTFSSAQDLIQYNDEFSFKKHENGKYRLYDTLNEISSFGELDKALKIDDKVYLLKGDTAIWFSGLDYSKFIFIPPALRQYETVYRHLPKKKDLEWSFVSGPDLYYVVSNGDKKGAIDSLGKIILPIEYDELEMIGGQYFNGKKGSTHFVLDKNSNVILKGEGSYWGLIENQNLVAIAGEYPGDDWDRNNYQPRQGLWDLQGRLICSECIISPIPTIVNKDLIVISNSGTFNGLFGIASISKRATVVPYKYRSTSWPDGDLLPIQKPSYNLMGKLSLKTLKELPETFIEHTFSRWNYCTDNNGRPFEGCLKSVQFTLTNHSDITIKSITFRLKITEDDNVLYSKTHTVSVNMAPEDTEITPYISLPTQVYYNGKKPSFELEFISAK